METIYLTNLLYVTLASIIIYSNLHNIIYLFPPESYHNNSYTDSFQIVEPLFEKLVNFLGHISSQRFSLLFERIISVLFGPQA